MLVHKPRKILTILAMIGCFMIAPILDTISFSSVINKDRLRWLSIFVISWSGMVWLSKDIARKVTLSMAWLYMLVLTPIPTSIPQALKTPTLPSSTLALSTVDL
jgi:hypothetical protein